MSRNPMLPIDTEISDEDGWRIVVAQEADGYWTMDKHGEERFVEAEVPASVSREWSPIDSYIDTDGNREEV